MRRGISQMSSDLRLLLFFRVHSVDVSLARTSRVTAVCDRCVMDYEETVMACENTRRELCVIELTQKISQTKQGDSQQNEAQQHNEAGPADAVPDDADTGEPCE